MRRSVVAVMLVLASILGGCATATLLPDGRVLFLDVISKIYDPATGRLANASLPPTGRVLDSATLLQDGKVLIAGGSVNNKTVATADVYDPATDTYQPTGPMAHKRAAHSATRLADGRVLITGGGKVDTDPADAGTPTKFPAPEIYDPTSGTFGPASEMGTPRVLQTATLLKDGRVLVTGGAGEPKKKGGQGKVLASTELYDPTTDTWSPSGDMSTPRAYHTATTLADGRVLIAGGVSTTDGLSKADATDPAPKSAEIYDPASGTFAPVDALVAARIGHSATLLPDGHVLLAGGYDQASKDHPFAATAELFDPVTGTSAATGEMTTGLAFHASSPTADGRVILAGLPYEALQGIMTTSSGSATNADFMSSAEVYDPVAGTFSALEVDPGVMPTPCPTKKDGSCKTT
jgi:hypothetical protein